MIRTTFFEDPAFTMMSAAQQKEFRRVLKKVGAFENSTGQKLDKGFTKEQYVDLFNSMNLRHVNSFYHHKTQLAKYVKYLVSIGIVDAEQSSILDSVSQDDLVVNGEKVHYYKNINMLYEAVKDTIESSESYDPAMFIPTVVEIFLSWYGLTRDEIVDYLKEDVLDDGIMIKGEKITPQPHILKYFTDMRDAIGYYQQARGVIFHTYVVSEYLIRSERKSHVQPMDITNQMSRFNRIMGCAYSLNPDVIRESGIFFRAYQLECESTQFDLDDPVFASKVFGDDFTSDPKKGKKKQYSYIADYKRYKQLFY